MSSPHHEPDGGFGERGPMFWLPPGGFSNGLEATNWAELADLGEGQLADVLFTLADAVVFVGAARLLRLTEVTSVIDTVARRLPGTRGR